ncbi:T9SS type A sorting domain-containing protein [Viscerimonas tarda]
MKKITKLMAALCLCCFVTTSAYALDFYLSANGDDKADGLTKETAVKTLRQIHLLMSDPENLLSNGGNNTIWVDGIIDMNNEPVSAPGASAAEAQGIMRLSANGGRQGFFFSNVGPWSNSIIKGLNEPEETMIDDDNSRVAFLPVDGFDSKGTGRIFAIDGQTHTFENILFTGGTDRVSDGGGVFWLRSSVINFNNCYFTKNYCALIDEDAMTWNSSVSQGNGGAITFLTGTMNITDCVFDDNLNKQGGAIFQSGGVLNITRSIFQNHNCAALYNAAGTSPDSHGGVIQIQNNHDRKATLNIDGCLFKNNNCYGDGGVIADRTSGGIVEEDKWLNINILNSAFINNSAGRGGAIFIDHKREAPQETFIANSFFYHNESRTDGSTILLWAATPNNKFTLVNSSLIDNATGGNGGHGPGVLFMHTEGYGQANRISAFYNDLLDGNGTSGGEYGIDFVYRGEVAPAAGQLTIANSMIGRVQGPGITIGDFDEPNEFNYYTGAEYTNAAGVVRSEDDPMAPIYLSEYYACPLLPDAFARTYGNAAYLTQFADRVDLTKDIFGFERVIDGGKCSIGAFEMNGDELVDLLGETEYPWNALGIKAADAVSNSNSLVIIGGVLQFAKAEQEQAKIAVISLSGATVKSGINQVSVENLPKGLYIAKAQLGGKVYVQKFIK